MNQRRPLLAIPLVLLAGGLLLASLPVVAIHSGDNRIELPSGQQQFLFWLRTPPMPEKDVWRLVFVGEGALNARILHLPWPKQAESWYLVWLFSDRPWGLSYTDQVQLPACCRVSTATSARPAQVALLLIDTNHGRTLSRLDLFF